MIGKDIDKAITFLKNGNLVAIPTETVYGLAANALNENAVLQIFKTKNRPSFDPLIVHISHINQLEKYVEQIPKVAYELAEQFWPGPLTLVLPKKKCIPDIVNSGLNAVGIRIPNHPMTLDLLSRLDFPLAAPSANPFGYVSPTSAQHVENQLGMSIPYILDGGNCKVGIESTIISFEYQIPQILRLGGIEIESIKSIIPNVEINISNNSNPTAPGMIDKHYATSKPLFIKTRQQIEQEFNFNAENIGLLIWGENQNLNHKYVFNLSESGNLNEAASHLFAFLRLLDQAKINEIWAESLPDEGLGKAINDRLMRASAR